MLRREVIKMGGGLFGLGKPDPSRFPYAGRPQPAPAVGPSSAAIVRANRVIVTGPNGGIYVYSGPPASGNLIESIGIVSAGFDPFNLNAVLPGDTRYHNNGAGVYVAQQSTQSYIGYLWQASSPLGPYTAMSTSIGFSNEFTASPVLDLQAGKAGGYISLDNAVKAFGPLTATAGTPASPTLITSGSWTAITSFGANFTASGSRPPAYLLTASGEVKLRGVVNLTAAQVTGAVMFTLPFTFTLAMFYVVPNSLSGAVLDGNVIEIAANGQVSIQAAGSNGNVVTLDNAGNWTI